MFHEFLFSFTKIFSFTSSSNIDPNVLKFYSFAAEIAHMLKKTQPKIIFCDSYNVLSIRDSLKLLKATVPIFAFGGKVDGARMVEELLVPCEKAELFW